MAVVFFIVYCFIVGLVYTLLSVFAKKVGLEGFEGDFFIPLISLSWPVGVPLLLLVLFYMFIFEKLDKLVQKLKD